MELVETRKKKLGEELKEERKVTGKKSKKSHSKKVAGQASQNHIKMEKNKIEK